MAVRVLLYRYHWVHGLQVLVEVSYLGEVGGTFWLDVGGEPVNIGPIT